MAISRELKSFGTFGIVSSLLTLVAFITLHAFDIPKGTFLDWVIGLASFWWLLAIVTIPWTLYFHARQVLTEADESIERDIAISPKKVQWIQNVAKHTLRGAIALHLASATAFGLLAYYNLLPLGYVCGSLALLLTLLRPGWRALEHIQRRLGQLNTEFHLPREDASTLFLQLDSLKSELRELGRNINRAWHQIESSKEDHDNLSQALANLSSENDKQHQLLAKTTNEAVRKLSEDAQFLNHVRELIRFIKSS